MTIITRYILRQIWAPTLLAWATISFFTVAAGVQRQMTLLLDQIPLTSIGLADIGRISALILPTLFGFIFPITFLLGIMLSFGRMAQHSELIALKAAGIPLKRIVAPVIVTGFLLSVLAFVIQDQVQPRAHAKLSDLVSQDLPLRVTIEMLPTGVMQEYGDWQVYIGGKEPGGVLTDLFILQSHPDGSADSFYAERARLVDIEGRSHIQLEQGLLIPADPERKAVFETLTRKTPQIVPERDELDRSEMTMTRLLQEERRLAATFEETRALPVMVELRKVRIDLGERLAFPLMCLAVSIVAAPVGARTPRSGRAASFAAGLIIVGGYYTLRKLVEPPFLPSLPVALLMAQIPNMVLCAIGAWLVWRVDRV